MSTADPTICVNCAHHEMHGIEHMCVAPTGRICYVTGEPVLQSGPCCQWNCTGNCPLYEAAEP